MKKIALCLYGNFNNRLSASSGVKGYEYIKEKILKDHKVDIFIHSWDSSNENEIKNLYSSAIKDAVFEPQVDFSKHITQANIDVEAFNKPGKQNFRTLFNSFSFFYTRAQAIQLKKNYEEKNGFKYDIVICSRFDLAQMDKYNGFQAYKVSEMPFDENLDMSYFYCPFWHQMNIGFPDMWFFSSSENMDKLIKMYDKAFNYFQQDSEYIKALTQGWPDSNAINDFSNEVFKKEKTNNLKTYELPDAHNNHMLHKWFLIDIGLYEKTKYLATLSSRFCTVMYSHSDCSDVWPLYFGQNKKHSKTMGPKFIFLDKEMPNIPEEYEQIIYDDSKSYPERVMSCLSKLKARGFEACLFEHEDMILYDDIDYPEMKNIINLVLRPSKGKPFRNGYDCIRLIKASGTYSFRDLVHKKVHYMLPFSKWLYSVQPSIWKIDSFIKMLEVHYGESIWSLEVKAQKTCRKLKLKCGYAHSDGEKRGALHWDNKIYPYIATAIVKGKWNTSEYDSVLSPMLTNYRVDKDQRGTV